MTLDLLSRILESVPFAPFDLHLSDGRVFSVRNSEFLMVAEDHRSVSLFEPPHTTDLIDLQHVGSIRLQDPNP